VCARGFLRFREGLSAYGHRSPDAPETCVPPLVRGRPLPALHCPVAPVAQWIEQRFPKPRALVRFRPGAFATPLSRRGRASALGIAPFFALATLAVTEAFVRGVQKQRLGD